MNLNSQTMANSTNKASKLLAIATAALASYQVSIPVGLLLRSIEGVAVDREE